ncbi:MAG TPA: DUF4407 domain-containing protein [Puia sp.]|nr:DUF4407 domain-containing protein [Puia sp.]
MRERRIHPAIATLCRLSGEDAAIIFDPETDAGVSGKYACIGLFVLVIFFVSFYSSVHFLIDLLDGNLIVAVPIGVFWGWMIANIYYLLLFTVTPPLLRGRDHANKGVRMEITTEKRWLSLVSLGFRLLFVLLLAIVIAQPWLITLFPTSKWVEQEREAYRKEFVRLAGSDDGQTGGLLTDGQQPGGLLVVQPHAGDPLGRRTGEDTSSAGRIQAEARRRIEELLTANNYYTRRIQLVQIHYQRSWMVTILVVLFFVIPIGLKCQIRNRTNFYEVKKALETSFVSDSYAGFKETYANIFAERFGIATTFYESCVDPPFNTRKKDAREELDDQRVFLERIYGDGEDAELHKTTVSEMIS